MKIKDLKKIEKCKKKAKKSICRFKISAIGFNKKGEVIYVSSNKPRFIRKYGGIHAEADLIKKAGPSLYKIYIIRVNKNGETLPIEPCKKCRSLAKKYNVKIFSI